MNNFSKVRKITVGILIFFLNISVLAAASAVFSSPEFQEFDTVRETLQSQSTLAAQLGVLTTTSEEENSSIINTRLLIAGGSSRYLISPGDTFSVSYLDSTQQKNMIVQADENCELDIPSIGIVGGYDVTLVQLKKEIINLIESYYPFSYPQVALTATGLFEVQISGPMTISTHFSAWGLTSLSYASRFVLPGANSREVKVTHRDGKEETIDLYKAVRGETEDILLRPGDSIYFSKATDTVTLTGAVERPGTYQIKNNEAYSDIINLYGGGFLAEADTTVLYVQSYNNGKIISKKISEEVLYSSVPTDGEIILINTVQNTNQTIIIEGAIRADENTSSSIVSQATRTRYSFFPGEKFVELLNDIQLNFLPGSDLSSAYIIRNGEALSLDIKATLAGDTSQNLEICDGDKLVIPFNQLFVSVTGAVNSTGSYSYVPNKTASYYVNLAGGVATSADDVKSWVIKDKEGNKLKSVDFLEPESEIYVKSDYFKTDFSTTVAIVGLASTILSMIVTAVSLASEI